jgi:hypothetical protein
MTLQSMDRQSEQLNEQLHGLQRDLSDVQSRLQLAECQVSN